MPASVNKPTRSHGLRPPLKGGVVRGRGVKPEAAVEVTFTAKLLALDPFSVTEAGDTVQVDSEGAPLQLSATV